MVSETKNNIAFLSMDLQFDETCPVFKDSEVAQRFLSFINEEQDVPVTERDVWTWLRTPPLETIVRNNLL